MAKYCDSEVLERNWFDWIVAEAVPVLEPYREIGALWTKVIGHVTDDDNKIIKKHGKALIDPGHSVRLHCVGIDRGIFIITNGGEIEITYADDMRLCQLPYDAPADVFINAEVFDPTDITNFGYRRERPAKDSWDDILEDIFKMCNGIAMRFNMPTAEDRDELASEAALQVIRKLKSRKLTYTPGRAPVFNLLTTTIYRCMFSALSKEQRRVRNMRAFADEIKAQHANLAQGTPSQ